jgi:hypothetical protein
MALKTPKVKGDETTAFFAKMATHMADHAYEQGMKDGRRAAVKILTSNPNLRNIKDAIALIEGEDGGGPAPEGVSSYNSSVSTMGSGLE